MHKLSNAVISYARNLNINTIVIGHNEGWKQSVDIGKKNNQEFVQIPFNILINQIYHKGREYGINVIKQEAHNSIIYITEVNPRKIVI